MEQIADENEITRRDFIASSFAVGLVSTLPEMAMPSPNSATSAPLYTSRPSYSKVNLHVTVNQKDYDTSIDTRTTLLDFLRENLGLTGSKKGCDHGQCGSCTVLVNGKRINSCLSLAAQSHGKRITTIEGLASNGKTHPMQQAFIDHDAFQCGFCTPGQIMSAVALLKEPCGNSEEDVRECMSGNICRCGAYRNILTAIDEVRNGRNKNAPV